MGRIKQIKGWKDVTLRQAQELIALDPKSYGDAEVLAYEVDQLAILLDQDPYHIETTMSVQEILDALKEYMFLNAMPKEDIAKKIDTFTHTGKSYNYNKFNVRGTRYGLMDFTALTLAQMVDIEEFVNLGIIPNMHKIMAVLYLPTKSWNPVTGKYTLKEYEPDPERENMFLEMDMDFVYSNLLFFYPIVMTFTGHTKDSLVETAHQQLKTMMTIADLNEVETLLK